MISCSRSMAHSLAYGLCFVVAILFSGILHAQSTVDQLQDFADPDAPIQVQAVWLEYNKAKDLYNFDGDVIITHGDLRLEADHVTMDMASQIATAEGDVWLTTPEATMVADTINLHMETQQGVILSGQFVVTDETNRYYLYGERIQKVGEERYLIINGGYSTCDCGPKTPSWQIKGKKLDVTLDGYGRIKHALFYWWKVPIFYTPYAFVPVKVTRQTGFLTPEIAYSEKEGAEVNLPFFWAIDEHVDATIYTHYIEKRGLKEGLEYRYAIFKEFFGELNTDIIQDREYGNRPGEFRWDFTYEGAFEIFRNLEIRHDVNMVSDPLYVVDFDQDIKARFDRYLRSVALITNRWDRYNLNVGVLGYQDLVREDNSYTYQRLPQINFAAMSRRFIKQLPFMYRFDVESINYHRKKIDTAEESLNQVYGEDIYTTRGERIVFTPEISIPWNMNHVAVLTPRAGLIESVYYLQDRSTWHPTLDETTGITTYERGEMGVRLWDVRHTYFLEADLSTELQRVYPFRARLVQGMKHSIEPGLSYHYQAEPQGQDNLPIFDGFDRLSRENWITAYLYNRLWVKAFSIKDQKLTNLRLIDFRITQQFDVEETLRPALYETKLRSDGSTYNEEVERRPFRDLQFDLRAMAATGFIIDKLLIKTQLDWNLYDLYLSRANALLALVTLRNDTAIVEYRYKTDDDGNKSIQSIVGSLNLRIIKTLSLQYSTKYSFMDNDFLENTYGIHYWSQQNCWDVQFTVEDKRRPDETVFRLLFNLTGLASLATSRGIE